MNQELRATCAGGCGKSFYRSESTSEHRTCRECKTRQMTIACERCGKNFRTYKSWGNRRFCSRTCHIEVMREAPRKWSSDANGYLVSNRGGRQVKQHRLVMEQTIGRPLWPDENVHHINGDRKDNRPENLEIWSSSQPPGQRVPDKVEWAVEILQRYSPDRLAK